LNASINFELPLGLPQRAYLAPRFRGGDKTGGLFGAIPLVVMPANAGIQLTPPISSPRALGLADDPAHASSLDPRFRGG